MSLLAETDRFEIRRCLGSGSFGVVYEAFDRERGTRVALKLPHAGGARDLYLFKQEFRALADVSHPNLVTYLELLTAGPRWFFTMELVEGAQILDFLRAPGTPLGSEPTREWPLGADELLGLPPATGGQDPVLEPFLPSPPPDYERVRAALRQVAEGLVALHGAGMLHRDLKPSNVLVTGQGRVVILDFGLARDVERFEAGDGELAGTPSYVSPEQAASGPATPASDWYAVGVLLYQVLTGRLPFTGTSRAVLLQKTQMEPLEPRHLVPGTPPDLEALCLGLLRRDPAVRFGGPQILESLLASPGRQPVRTARPDLVGREGELELLLGAFDRVAAAGPVVALLHGDSGTGKSALAQAFQHEIRAREAGSVVFQGRCFEQETVPFKALDSLVDDLSQHLKRLPVRDLQALLPPQASALARLFPVLSQVAPIGEGGAEADLPDAQELRRRGFGALRELLRRMTLRSPVVLVIDDLQWGDLDSAALLQDLLRPPDPPRLLLLLCFRSGEAHSSPVLRELLPRLQEFGVLRQDVELRALSRELARELARRLLGPEREDQAERVAGESGGSPFFVRELARHLRQALPAEPAEGSLDDYIRVRAATLPAEAQRILATLAIAGYPLDWDLVRQVAGVGPESFALLTRLRTERLIRTRSTDRRRFLETYHDRIRMALAPAEGAPGLREVHLALGVALEARGSTDAQALARHFEAGGRRDKASAYSVQAAAQAELALAFDQAAAHYRKALRLGDPLDPENTTLRRRLGDALSNAGHCREAAEVYLEAAQEGAGPDLSRLQRRAAEEYLRSGYLEAGLGILDRLLAQIGTHLPIGRLGSMTSLVWHRLRLWVRGMGFRERPAAQIPPAQLERVDTLWAVAMGLGPVEVLRAADFQTRQLLLALAVGEPFRVVRALAHESILVGAAGSRALEPTHRLVARTLALAEAIDHPNPRARALMAAGMTDSLLGRWRSSAERLELVEALLREHCTGMGYELHLAQHHGLLARLVLGDLDRLRERLPVLLQEAREQGNLAATTNLRAGLSYVLYLAQDEPEAARADLQATLEAWSRRDFHVQHYHHLVSRVNVELYAGDFQEAFRLTEEAETGLRRSLLLKMQPILVTFLELRARTALALAARSSAPASFLACAEAYRQRLLAERTSYGQALALKLQAMEAQLRGDRPAALARLLRAELTFDACDMVLHVLSLRYVRGRLGEDPALRDAAQEALAAKGIREPGRFAAMHVPLGP